MACTAFPLTAFVRLCALLVGLAGLAAGVSGCSTSPEASAAFASANTKAPVGAGIASNPTLVAVTTRNAVKGAKSKPWFGTQRANQPSNVRIQMSPPADGVFGAVGLGDWSIKTIDAIPFGESFSAGASRREVLVYIHGFNQTFETAALDAARLSDGLKFRGDTMLFSWPSKNSLMNYIYDRESAMWSRDALEEMLDAVDHGPVRRHRSHCRAFHGHDGDRRSAAAALRSARRIDGKPLWRRRSGVARYRHRWFQIVNYARLAVFRARSPF